MKIVIFMDNPVVATGFANTCRLTGAEFVKRGHEVYAVAFNGGPQPEGTFGDWYGIRIVPNYALERNPNAIYGDAETVLRIEKEIDPDIYFFHNDSYRYSFLDQMSDRILERSVFWLPFEGKEKDHGGIPIFKRISATRFVTSYAKALHEEELKGFDIGVIPHAVDSSIFRPSEDKAEAKVSAGLAGKFVVARVDRHQPRKYWDRTIRAFAEFAKGKDDVFLLAKCDPRDCAMYDHASKSGTDLELLAKDLGMADKIKFDDFFFNPDCLVKTFYDPADVMLTTTSGEGFGLGIAEAMACGLPIICPDVPVLPEIVGQTGMFCRISGSEYSKMNVLHDLVDIDEVVGRLNETYSHWKKGDDRLVSVGLAGRRRVMEKFDPTVVYDAWDAVLAEVVQKKDKVSVVTVLYNCYGEQLYGEDGIEKLRESLELHVRHPFEWVIVDNGSPLSIETREWLATAAKRDKRIVPVLSDRNLGFAGGCNLGISNSKCKNVILLNPDCEALSPAKLGLPDDFIAMMLQRMRSNPRIGIVGMQLWRRDDILTGTKFPYFCNAMISRECLNACRKENGQYLDEDFWPAYYEDCDFVIRAIGKGFKVVDHNVPFWHKSGGTNKHAIEGGKDGSVAEKLSSVLATMPNTPPVIRKKTEVAAFGMQGLIAGNIGHLNALYGPAKRAGIRVVWHTKIGDAVGFSAIAEGLIPELHKLGFDVYVNDWNNGRNVEDPLIRTLIDKTLAAKEEGVDLSNAINIVCWLMEAFLDVDADYKVGVSFCESTKVRPQYLNCCNQMDRILTFSDFCRGVQLDSGFKSPINVITPGVNQKFAAFHQRPRREKFTFLTVGVAQERKDTRRLVEAFAEAFPKGAARPPECEEGFPTHCSDIELVLKSNVFGELDWIHREGFPARANIRTIFTGSHPAAQRPDLTTQEMYDLYCSADCLVHSSHGEGIGMPILEAAGTGLPVIFTNWSSPAEYLDESVSYPCSLSPYPGTTFSDAYVGAGSSIPGENGKWANCFAKGTPVRTPGGMTPIESLKQGDLVLTHLGRYRRVVGLSKRTFSGNAISIVGTYNNHPIVATGEHPFMIGKSGGMEFRHASELRVGDVLVMPFVRDEKAIPDIDLSEFVGKRGRFDDKSVWLSGPRFKERMDATRCSINTVASESGTSKSVAQRALSNGGILVGHEINQRINEVANRLGYFKPETKRIPRYVCVNGPFARLSGYYLAEGCCSKSAIIFSFNVRERGHVEDVLALMKDIFGLDGSAYKNGDNGVTVTFSNAIVSRMFENLFGKYARNKKTPDSWAFLSKDVAIELFRGLWYGDGCRESNCFSYKTSSASLAYQVNSICGKFGVSSSILRNRIGQYVVKIFGSKNTGIVSAMLAEKDFLKSADRKTRNIVSDANNVYLPIRRIDTVVIDGPTYNIEVEEDNTYCVASAAVHNCNIGHLKHLMYHVVRNRNEAVVKGQAAAALVAKKFTWDESARDLMPLLFEWDEERKNKVMREDFDPATFVKPPMKPVNAGDRVMIDIVTRDRHSYLCSLITSLLDQTFQDWDLIIQCDDVDDAMPSDFQIMSTMNRLMHEGHAWRIIRSHRQGPHIAHDRTLCMTRDDPYKYKLVCRIDDDIVIKPDFLERLFSVFLEDRGCELGAVSGVYLDPKRSVAEQTAPPGYEADIEYAGKIDHNVPWPYICAYPKGTKCRDVEHLYSTFMYRVEAAVAVGGYCKMYSQIGHREESDFSYRMFLGGWKMKINPEAVGFHYSAPGGGIRSGSIVNREALAGSDHKIYSRRLAKWKAAASKRKGTPSVPRLLAVINAGTDPSVAARAVTSALKMTPDVYVTTPSGKVRDAVMDRVKMVAVTPDETAALTKAVATSQDFDFILTVNDTMSFTSDPVRELSGRYDNYVYETYSTYSGKDRTVGTELRNACLIHKIGSASKDLTRTLYSNIRVIDELDLYPTNGKSALGNPLIKISDMDRVKWTKICVHQFPDGDLAQPKKADFVPTGPLVSIIIPTAGRKDLLARSINSIFSFTTTPFEIIVVDNGSSDGTYEWLRDESRKRPNVRCLRQSSNLGYQKAINVGIAASSAEYVMLFNDDAWIESPEPDGRDWLRHCIDALVPGVGIVGPHGCNSPALGIDMLFFWCVMLRRSVINEIGPLDDIVFLNYGGDDDYCMRLSKKGYAVRQEYLHLRHLMNLVPDAKKKPELERSEAALRKKWLAS